MIIGRIRGRLDYESILAADIFLNFDENFHIGKAADLSFGQGEAQIGSNTFRQSPIGIARENFDCFRHNCASSTPSVARLLAALRASNNIKTMHQKLIHWIENAGLFRP